MTTVKRVVIEWPSMGSARRFPMGGFWIAESPIGQDGPYFPLAGPFRTSGEARGVLSDMYWYTPTAGAITRGYITRGCTCRAGCDRVDELRNVRVLSADPCPSHTIEYYYHRGQTFLSELDEPHADDCRCFHCRNVRDYEERERERAELA